MSSPAPRPAPEAPAAAWRAWRRAMRREDRRARRAVPCGHPVLRRGYHGPLDVLERRLASGDGEVLKPGPGARVLRLGDGLVLKHAPPTRRLDPRDRLGRSKAVRSLLAAEALARRGFGVARPLAAWSRPGGGSYLLLEDLPRHRPLHQAVLEVRGDERAALLAAVAATVRALHRAGVAHRDLKPSNLLVDLEADDLDLRFVDHDRHRFLPVATPAVLARRDLAALHAGLPPEVRAAERLAALRAYDAAWTERPTWRRHVVPLLAEAAARRHRWRPRRLLSGGNGAALERAAEPG